MDFSICRELHLFNYDTYICIYMIINATYIYFNKVFQSCYLINKKRYIHVHVYNYWIKSLIVAFWHFQLHISLFIYSIIFFDYFCFQILGFYFKMFCLFWFVNFNLRNVFMQRLLTHLYKSHLQCIFIKVQ